MGYIEDMFITLRQIWSKKWELLSLLFTAINSSSCVVAIFNYLEVTGRSLFPYLSWTKIRTKYEKSEEYWEYKIFLIEKEITYNNTISMILYR